MADHPNVGLLRNGYDAFAKGDMDTVRDFFAEDPDRYYSDDEFHPSAAGYGLWADAIFPVLIEALDRRR